MQEINPPLKTLSTSILGKSLLTLVVGVILFLISEEIFLMFFVAVMFLICASVVRTLIAYKSSLSKLKFSLLSLLLVFLSGQYLSSAYGFYSTSSQESNAVVSITY